MTFTRLLLVIIVSCLMASCSYLSFLQPQPQPTSLDQRLATIPTNGLALKGRTVIYWDQYQIPFVEAEYDEDAAMALGLVHAHLRLGQMEMGRRIAQGRLSEMVGSLAVDVDHAIRTIDFARAVPEMEAAMSEDTRRWLEAFVAGINHYIANVEELPHEYAVLGFDREPWTVADLLTFSRLAGSDANWSIWMTALQLREREDWPEIWAELIKTGSSARATFDGLKPDNLEEVLGVYRRSGSNVMAIAPSRSRTGATLFAADPHVAYIAPTIWLLVGLKSPSYDIVGIMPSGTPFFALGRNPSIAWGGTNLYAASSSFYDVSAVSEEDISVRTERIWTGSSDFVEVEIRETEWGPIISDLAGLKKFSIPPTALRWVGHMPSDEISAMLGANRATSFEEFRAAFGTYAVSGMNMMFADKSGNIGQVQAVRVPVRPKTIPPDIINDPADIEPYWQSFVDATSLPVYYNPKIGYVATSNNKPPEGDVPVGIFFSTNDRISRINELMRETEKVDIATLKRFQRDVYQASSVELRDAFMAKIDGFGLAAGTNRQERKVLDLMAGWNGHYEAQSRGALAYELFRQGYVTAARRKEFGDKDFTGLTDVIGAEFAVLNDLQGPDEEFVRGKLGAALASAARQIDEHADWGSVHRLQLGHPFAYIPLVDDTYKYGNYRYGGGIQTLMKSGFNPGAQNFKPYHGATARFISDLSDPDSNYFVLVSGQDGWLNSSTFLDQMPLFVAGDYIQLPLGVDAARARAVHVDELQ